MRVHRFQNPFDHWLSGLLAELAVMAGLLLLLVAASAGMFALAAWIGR